jgi:hypothetical protein
MTQRHLGSSVKSERSWTWNRVSIMTSSDGIPSWSHTIFQEGTCWRITVNNLYCAVVKKTKKKTYGRVKRLPTAKVIIPRGAIGIRGARVQSMNSVRTPNRTNRTLVRFKVRPPSRTANRVRFKVRAGGGIYLNSFLIWKEFGRTEPKPDELNPKVRFGVRQKKAKNRTEPNCSTPTAAGSNQAPTATHRVDYNQ